MPLDRMFLLYPIRSLQIPLRRNWFQQTRLNCGLTVSFLRRKIQRTTAAASRTERLLHET